METAQKQILEELTSWREGAVALSDMMEKTNVTMAQYAQLNRLLSLIEQRISRLQEALTVPPHTS